MLGLDYSLRDVTFNTFNYSSHHAVGNLAEQLVRKGMLDAAEERTTGNMEGQTVNTQHPAVETKSE